MKVRVYIATLLTAAALFISPARADVSPAPSASPSPATLYPPNGWKERSADIAMGPIKVDRMWVGPERNGVILVAHLDLEGLGTIDLDTLGKFMVQGMSLNPGSKVEASKHVKICGGKQDALLANLATPTTVEDLVIAISDRGYLAQYVRHSNVPADPAAVNALLSLCTP